MIDLGTYAAPVIAAYAVTLTCLLALIVAVVLRARRIKAELARMETPDQ